MTSSQSITNISVALVKAQKDMGNAKKDSINPFFKKSYADLNAIREAVLPSLNANGISVLQPTCIVEGKSYVETILLHESGEYISSLTEIIVDKPNDAQRHGSGLSYARRYALASIVNIGAEDDDANSATSKKQDQKQPPKTGSKKTRLNDIGFKKLIERLAEPGADIDGIVKMTMETLALTDDQASLFAGKVAELQTPAA